MQLLVTATAALSCNDCSKKYLKKDKIKIGVPTWSYIARNAGFCWDLETF